VAQGQVRILSYEPLPATPPAGPRIAAFEPLDEPVPAPRAPIAARGTGLDVRPVGEAWETVNRSLTPWIATGAHALEEKIAAPSPAGRAFDLIASLTTGTRPGAARGFVAGATGATGDVISSFTSPASLAEMAASGGTRLALKRGLTGLATGLRAVEAGAGAAFGIEGAEQILSDPTLAGKLVGVANLAGGAAGVASASRPHPSGLKERSESLKETFPVEQPAIAKVEPLEGIEGLKPVEAIAAPAIAKVEPLEPRTVVSDAYASRPDPAEAQQPSSILNALTPDELATRRPDDAQSPEAVAAHLAAAAERPPRDPTFVLDTATPAYEKLTPAEQREVRRIDAELDAFQFQRGTTIDDPNPTASPEGWTDSSKNRNAFEANPAHPNLVRHTAGAPVLHAINVTTKRTNRDIRAAIARYIAGGKPSSLIVDVVREARKQANSLEGRARISMTHEMVDTVPDAPGTEFEFGENLPVETRLPDDVGAVRDREVAHPTFEQPKARPEDFELTGESVEKGRTQGALFDDARASVGSPTRALYDQVRPQARPFSGRPVSEPQVVDRMRQIFAIPQRTGLIERLTLGRASRPLPVRTGRSGVLSRAFGVYFPETAMTRLRRHGDLTTFSHELGHHIDFNIFDDVGKPVGLFKAELERLGEPTTPKSKIGTDYHLAEGVAEYFRIRLADPQLATRQAPGFTQALDTVFSQAPTFKRQVDEASGLVQRYLAQPLEVRGRARVDVAPLGVRGRVRDVIGEVKSNPERGSWPRRFAHALRDTQNLPDAAVHRRGAVDRFVSLFTDRHRAIWRAVRDSQGNSLPASHNAYVLARLADKAPAMAEAFLKVGPRGLDGRFVGSSLDAALKPMGHRLYPDANDPARPNLVTYLVALRASELHHEGLGRWPGLTPEEAKAVIDRTAADPEFDGFKAAAKGVYSYLGGLRKYAQDYGAMSAAQVKKLEEAVFYIPLKRVMDQADEGVAPGAAKFADRQSPIKRLKGSGRDIIDPIESIVRNTFAMTSFVQRNHAAATLVKSVAGTADSGAILQRIATPQEGTSFSLKQVQKQALEAMAQAGVLDPDALLPAFASGALDKAFDELVTVYTPTAFGRPGERILFVMDHGERKFYQVQDEALYQNLVALGPGPTDVLMRLAGRFAEALRTGVTTSGTFAIKNLVRDTVGAYFQSRHGFLPVYDHFRALKSQLTQDEDYGRFIAFGINQATLAGNNRGQLRAALDNAIAPKRWPSKLFKPVLHPFRFLQDFSAALETTTRLGEFKVALDTGGEERRAGVLGTFQRARDVGKKRPAVNEEALTVAALAASDVTVDFSRGGNLTKNLSTVSAFLNARVQGMVRMGETFKRDPVGVALTGASMAAVSAILWEWNKDDEAYRELDPQLKRDYWFVRLPGTDYWLTPPKPFEYSIFANLTEATLEQARASDRPEALHPLRDFVQAQGVAFLAQVLPSMVVPTLEVTTNYSYYRRRQIVPFWKEKLEPDLQVNDWTSETARVVANAIGVSPAKFEHFIRGTFGNLGGEVLAGTDVIAGLAGGKTRPPAPATGVERLPVVRALIKPRRVEGRAASMDEFYRRLNELEGAEASLKAYTAGDGRTDAKAFAQQLGQTWTPARMARMKQAKSRIDEIRDQLETVRGSATLSPEDKRTRVDHLHTQLARWARHGLEGDRP